MDDALDFIASVGDADVWYLDGLRRYPEITLGSLQIPDYIPTPEPVKDLINDFSENVFFPSVQKVANSRYEELCQLIHEVDSVKCVDDEITYDLKQYLIEAEVPYVVDLINNTSLKENVRLPPNLLQRMQQVKNIPLCDKYTPIVTQLPKILLGLPR
jgi:hypothetical protein